MIVESSVIRTTDSQQAQVGQDYWYAPYFSFIENNPEVRAFSIINADWDSQQQFSRFGWGDCRIQAYPIILQNWRAKISEDPFLHSNAQLYEQLGFSTP